MVELFYQQSAPDPPELPGPPDLPPPRALPGDPGLPIDPGVGPAQEALGRYRRRAQAKLHDLQQRLARAEGDRASAGSRRARLAHLADLRRAQANQLRRRAAGARKQANGAEKQMVDERRSALEEVQAQRAAYTTQLLNWFGNRASAFALAVWLLLMASLAAGWRPMLLWLALRRTRGLDGATYAKAVAIAAATVAGGAVAASASAPAFTGALAPVAVPVIAAMVVLLGLAAWRSTAVKAGPAGVSPALMGRRVAPGTAVVLTLVAGLGVGLIGFMEAEPAEPHIAPRTAALSRLAEPDPTARPTKRVVRLRRKADHADSRARQADVRAATAEGMLRNSEEAVSAVDERISRAGRAVDRWQQLVDRLSGR